MFLFKPFISSKPLSLTLSLKLSFHKRSMLNRLSFSKGTDKVLTLLEKHQLAKAALALNKIITDPKTINEIVQSSQMKIATSALTKQSIDYIENSNEGTAIMRTNFLASIATHIQFSITELEKHLKDPKITYVAAAKQTAAPVRSLIETLVITKFTKQFHSVITKVDLTNDIFIKSTSNSKSENNNPDAFVTFKVNAESNNTVIKPMDVKMTNLEDDYLRGHLREMNIQNNEIVAYPNTSKMTLVDYYSGTFHRLINEITLANIKTTMHKNELSLYEKKTKYFRELLNGDENMILQRHSELQNTLMEINLLPGFVRAPTFVNLHYIQNMALTENEMKFLEYMANKADVNTLSKESYMTNYLIESLKIYRDLYDAKVYHNIKPLVKIYPWIKHGLSNVIPNDFFT